MQAAGGQHHRPRQRLDRRQALKLGAGAVGALAVGGAVWDLMGGAEEEPGRDQDDEKRLHAFDARTGKRRWTVPSFATSPGENTLLTADAASVRLLWSAGQGGLDEDVTTVRAHAARDGRELWETERPTSSYSLSAAPRNLLIVGYLEDWYGYDSRTGRARWRVRAGEDTAGTPPLAADGRLFCTNETGVTAVRVGTRPRP